MEVDESYLDEVAAATDPHVIVLLNFSRDQLDRVGEVRTVARRVGDAVAAHPGARVVAFADDVLCAGAGMRAGGGPVWVSSPTRWTGDAGVCPRCDGAVTRAGVRWACSACGLARPDGDWTLVDDTARRRCTAPTAARRRSTCSCPGTRTGSTPCSPWPSARSSASIPRSRRPGCAGSTQVGGRYRTVTRPGGTTRLLLAKNPAGWAQVLDLLEEGPPRPVVVAVNSREADGRDVSWLWDVRVRAARRSPAGRGGGAGRVTSRCAWPTRGWPTGWPTTRSPPPATPSARST